VCLPLQPRCVNCGPDAIDTWIADIAQFLKTVDPNHLVTVGEEGEQCQPDQTQHPAREGAAQTLRWSPRAWGLWLSYVTSQQAPSYIADQGTWWAMLICSVLVLWGRAGHADMDVGARLTVSH